MKYLLMNLDILGGKLVQDYFTELFKEVAYGAKYTIKNQKATFSYIAIPMEEEVNCDRTELEILKTHFSFTGKQITDEILLSTAKILMNYKTGLEGINKEKFSITIIDIIDSSNMNIFYTDGSFKKATEEASYACCQLLNETCGEKCSYDDFTQTVKEYKDFSGVIQHGTNNIGELTGIKTALELVGENRFQVIISDSEYSIKAYREWIYNWKENFWKNYANKPIANSELIQETFELITRLRNENKIILFKWTAGHNNNPFNEECDKLAKGALGLSK